MNTTKRYSSTDELTNIEPRELRELRHLAGFLTSAKIEVARVEAEKDAPADVINYWREELRVAQDDFDMEWAALSALQELRSDVAPTVAPKPAKCPFYGNIRAFYAVAGEYGLNLKASAAMRAAFSCLLGRDITTRRELTPSDWNRAANAVADGRLYW